MATQGEAQPEPGEDPATVNFSAINSTVEVLLNLQEPSQWEDERRAIYLIWVPIMLFFCVVAAVTNLTICLTSRLVRQPLTPTMCFSISLAGADAYAASSLGLGLLFNSLLPLAFEALRLGGVISTAAHLLALALNHYVGILRPLHYARLITRSRVLTVVVFLWIVPIVFFFVCFAAMDAFAPTGCSSAFMDFSTFRRVVATLFFIPLICMVFAYSHMFVIVRQHQRGVLRNHNASQLNKNVKAIVTTLCILGTYVLGWMPALLTFMLICKDCHFNGADLNPRAFLALNILFNTLVILKCLVDPVIYAARMPEIKQALRRLRALLRCQRGSMEELGRTQTLIPILSYRYRFSRSTTSSSRLSTLRRTDEAIIPLRVFKASRSPAEPVDC
ncbi:adrenocorticotropic hormone receptor-like [Pollicipes pollicipes]|uniref:adrenocorticotropic hormone receptor-like n=1 Tax=Pollicipes pollicipes TaxID=41117 RepID=UPI0018857A40|nr:adrenocorticotropic hormone receptor-like [Pollicipes pollicipes]